MKLDAVNTYYVHIMSGNFL